MRFKVLSIILLCIVTHVNAQKKPENVVKAFGESLSSFCRTNEIIYREKIDELCSGAKKCRVEDKIHAEYQKERGLTNYETFVLDSYMNMFEALIPQSLNYQMSNIKVVGSDEMPDGTLTFITADINVSGAINKKVTDLFLVRNEKISGIYSYSSNLGFNHLNSSLIRALEFGRYSWAASIYNGYVQVANEVGKEGLINIYGDVIIPCIWDGISYIGGDFVWGFNYKDDSKDYSITYDLRSEGKRTPLYRIQDFIVGRNKITTTFSEDYAVAFNENMKHGYLNRYDSTYSVQYIYDDATRFCDGYAFIKYNGVGMIIDKKFTPILKDTESYTICDRLYEGLAKVKDRNTGKYGFINRNGKLIIPCVYDMTYEFSNGICPIALGKDIHNLKWGCINTKGQVVIPIIYDGFWSSFEDGYLEAMKEGHGTLLGIDGKPLPGFSWEYDDVRRIHNGFARFKKNGKFGFLNKRGEVVIPPIYDFATFFVDGIACVSIDDKYGKYKYGGINTDGVLVIPCIYDEIFYFNNGISLVKKDNKVGLVDRYGNSSFFPQKQE